MRRYVFVLAAAGACACASIDRAAVRATTDVLVRGREAALEESDVELAREAYPSQLKLVDALLVSAPDDRKLLRLSAEGYAGAAFLFLEDSAPARAKNFYLRARDRSLRSLTRNPAFRDLAVLPSDRIRDRLRAAVTDDVPDLYWAAFSWAAAINLSKDDPGAVAELPLAEALMARASELDPSFQFYGADLFFGVAYASRSRLLGGDPAKAKAAFDRADQGNGGRYLFGRLLTARWYAVAVQDKELFRRLLTSVLEAPAGALPEARLADEAAKKKAAGLLEKIDDFF